MNYKDIGVVLFSEPSKGHIGLAYSKSDDYFIVESYENLKDQSCKLWISNLSQDFIKNKDAESYLKANDYFGVKLDILIYQLGLLNEKNETILRSLYKILNNIISTMYSYYAVLPNNNTLINDLINKFDLKNILIDKKENDFVKKTLGKNNKNFEICNTDTRQNEIEMYLTFPRYNYYRDICKISFPKGEWKKLKNEDLIKKDKEFFLSLAEKFHYIIECKISNIPDDIKSLFNKSYINEKVWINDYEYYFISKLCKVDIYNLYICKEKCHLIDIEPKKLFKAKSYERTSISKGVCAFNYVNSFINSDENSIMSSWIKIYDRSKMLSFSAVFQKMGIKVLSYGSGSILVSFKNNKENIELIKKICEKTGLNYPVYLLTI